MLKYKLLLNHHGYYQKKKNVDSSIKTRIKSHVENNKYNLLFVPVIIFTTRIDTKRTCQ